MSRDADGEPVPGNHERVPVVRGCMRGLGAVLVGALLTLAVGCGDTEPEGPPIRGDTSATETVAVLSGSAAGGTVTEDAIRLDAKTGLDVLLAGVRKHLADQVRAEATAADVPDGSVLLGQVVEISCDEPTEVEVRASAGGVKLVALPAPMHRPECFAPVTTIALVVVDENLFAD